MKKYRPFPAPGIRPKKSLGQHFLVDERILQEIASLAFAGPDDFILEVGPGPGNLTKYLVQKARKVIAVELDSVLARDLPGRVPAENLQVLDANILRIDFNQIRPPNRKLKVVANLPYNISTQVIFKLLETPGVFSELYLMLQKEVAERVVAAPGGKDYGILSVVAQYHSDPEILMTIGPEAFKPRPKVDSALVKFRVLDQPRLPAKNYDDFKKVVRAAFSLRRKILKNSLARSGLGLSPPEVDQLLGRAGIDPQIRPERLSLQKFVELANLWTDA